MASPTIKIHKGTSKKLPKQKYYYFTVQSSNGQVLATSETYTRKRNCKKGVDALVYGMAYGDEIRVRDLTGE